MQIKRKPAAAIAEAQDAEAEPEAPAIKRKPAAAIAEAQDVEAEAEAPAKLRKNGKGAKAEMEVDAGAEEETPPTACDEPARQTTEEEEQAAARGKELKAMAVEDLKKLAEQLGLEKAKKAEMVEAVLQHEAEVRRRQREREATLRGLVLQKKAELQAQPAGELAQQCKAAGAWGQMSKEARVELLLTRWQAQGGIEQGLAQLARDRRRAALLALGCEELRALCEESGLDPLVQEVMVDRLLRREAALGRFAPPAAAGEEEAARAPEPEAKGDLVSALLANEAARAKKQAEEARQQEREAQEAQKRDELRSATVAELRRRLAAKGAAAGGTKDELVEAVFAQEAKDAAVAERKASLKELGKDGLKELLASKGLKAGGGVNGMVDAILQHEAKGEEERRAYEAQVLEQLKRTKEELEAKTGAQLKELCAAKGLAAGASNEDRVQRLLRAAREDGDIDREISLAARQARRKALEATDKAALLELCSELGVDPYVKAVLAERLFEHEAEAGLIAAEGA